MFLSVFFHKLIIFSVPKRKRGRTSAAVKRQRMEKADELLKSTVNGADQKQETPASNV